MFVDYMDIFKEVFFYGFYIDIKEVPGRFGYLEKNLVRGESSEF